MVKKSYFFSINVINLFIIVFLLVIIFSSMICGCKKKKEGLSNQKQFVLVHMKECGHCKTLMPEWDKASKENKTDIKMRKVEMSEGDGPELCKKHNITGFPTMFILENGNKIKDFNGERNKDSLLSFLQEN